MNFASLYGKTARGLIEHQRLPDDAPLTAFQQQYAFLGFPPWPGASEEQDKQRYIVSYSLAVLLVEATSAALICALGVVLLLILTRWSANNPWLVDELSYWPLNDILRNSITSYQSSDSAPINLTRLLVVTSWVNFIWVCWLVVRVRHELFRREYLVDRPNMPYIAPFCAFLLLFLLVGGPAEYQTFFVPPLKDSLPILSIKEAIYISIMYGTLGWSIFYFSTRYREILRKVSDRRKK